MTLLWSTLTLAVAGSGGGGQALSSTLHLEANEEERLGIEVEPVRASTGRTSRVYRGVLVAPGSAGGLSYTPLSASVDAESAARVAAAWATAVEGVRINEADLQLARQELERATRLASGDAGSERRVDEARAAVSRQQARLRGAQDRARYAKRLVVDTPPNPWVRVPVYLGDRAQLDLQASATVQGMFRGSHAMEVSPVKGPRSADPNAGTFDVFYDATGFDGGLGEAVAVSVPTHSDDRGPSVSQHAVVYDPNGVAWVYVQHDEGTYERVRAPIRSCEGGRCRLNGGPAVGTSIVISGAAELFGHDLGMGR